MAFELPNVAGALGIGGGPSPSPAPVANPAPYVGPPAPVPVYGPPNLAAGQVSADQPAAVPGGAPLFDDKKIAGALGLGGLPKQLQGASSAFTNATAALGITPDQIRETAARNRISPAKEEQKVDSAEKTIETAQTAPQGPPPAQYIAAHWDPSRNPLRKETLAGIERAQGQQREGLAEQGAEATRVAEEQARTFENYQRIQENQHLLEIQAAAKRADAQRAQEMRIDEAMQEARDARVNPNRVQENMGAPEWIAHMAGSAASGLYQGYMQTMLGQNVENQFQKQFDRVVQADIDKQKQDVAAKQQGVQDQINIFDRMKQRFGDDMQAEAATRAYYAEQLKTELTRIGAQSDSQFAQANSKMAIGQLDEMQKKDMGRLRDVAEFVPGHVVGGGAGAADKNRDKVFEYDGQRYEARDPAQAAKLAEGAAAAVEFKRLAHQLDVLRDDPSTYASFFGVQLTDKAAEAKNISERMITQLSTMANSGTINAGEYGRYQEQLGDPNAVTSRAGMKGKQWAGMIDKHVRDSLRSNAVEQVQTGYKENAQGQTVPTAAYTGNSPTKTSLPAGFKAQ